MWRGRHETCFARFCCSFCFTTSESASFLTITCLAVEEWNARRNFEGSDLAWIKANLSSIATHRSRLDETYLFVHSKVRILFTFHDRSIEKSLFYLFIPDGINLVLLIKEESLQLRALRISVPSRPVVLRAPSISDAEQLVGVRSRLY